jgi:hypothetical protein
MHILLVSQAYHQRVGGVETQMQLVANELARRHRLEVLTLPCFRASDPAMTT